MTWRDAILDAWAVLFPVECAGCGSPDRGVCADCTAALIPMPVLRSTAGGLAVWSALEYAGVVRRILLALKEQERTDVAAQLAPPLAAAVATAAARASAGARSPVELTTVPTSRAARRRRGYDPVALLARRAGLHTVRVLRHTRTTASQKTLGVGDRAANLVGALAATGPLAGRSFLIIDDVLTTGATLDEAARAIRGAGGAVLGAATLAFTARLLPARDTSTGQDYRWPQGAQQSSAWTGSFSPGGSA